MKFSSYQAVYVTDIPYVTDDLEELKDKLEVYFGQRKHGGGEIETIICSVGGNISQAFVVFESGEVAKTAAHYNIHVFLEEEIKVALLPEIYSYVEVELEDYYWDILTRDKAKALISTLTSQLGQDHVFHNQKKILKLHGSYKQLEEIKKCIPKAAGIGLSSEAAAEEKQDVLARSVELSDIPFVFDDYDKLKLVESLQDCIERSCGAKVDSIICPVKGNMTKAIVVFQSESDRDNYLQQESHTFDGDDMQCKILPPVYKKATITLNTFYTSIVPKLRRSKIEEQLKEKYHSEITAGQVITGPFENLMDIVSTWMEEAGFPFVFTSGNEHQGLLSDHTDETASREESKYVPIAADNEMDGNIENLDNRQPDSLNSWVHITSESVANESQDGASGGELKVTLTQKEQNPAESINSASVDKHEEDIRPVLDTDNTLHNEKEDKTTTSARKSSTDDWEDLGRVESTETTGAQNHSDRDAASNIDQSNGSNVPDDVLEIRDDGDVMNEQHDARNDEGENISAPFLAVCKNKFETNQGSVPDTDKNQQEADSVDESIESGANVKTLDSNQSEIRSDFGKTEDQEDVKKEQADQTPDDIGILPDTVKNNQIKLEKGDSLVQHERQAWNFVKEESDDSRNTINNPTPNNGLQEHYFEMNSSSANADKKEVKPKRKPKQSKLAATFNGVQTSTHEGSVSQALQTAKDGTTSNQSDDKPGKTERATASDMKIKHTKSQTSKKKTNDEKTDEPRKSEKLVSASEKETLDNKDKAAQFPTEPSQKKTERQMNTKFATLDDEETENDPSATVSETGTSGYNDIHSPSPAMEELPMNDETGKEPSTAATETGMQCYSDNHNQSPTREEIDKKQIQNKDDATEKLEDEKTGKEPSATSTDTGLSGYSGIQSTAREAKNKLQNKDDVTEKPKVDKPGEGSNAIKSRNETLKPNNKHVLSGEGDNEPTQRQDILADKGVNLGKEPESIKALTKKETDRNTDERALSSTSQVTDEGHMQSIEDATADEPVDDNSQNAAPAREDRTPGSIDEDGRNVEDAAANESHSESQSKPKQDQNLNTRGSEVNSSTAKTNNITNSSTLKDESSTSKALIQKKNRDDLPNEDAPQVSETGLVSDSMGENQSKEIVSSTHMHDTAKTKLLDTNKASHSAATASNNYSRKTRETGEKHESSNSKASKRKLEQSGKTTLNLDPDVKKVKEEEGFPKNTSIKHPPTSNTVLSSNSNELMQESNKPDSTKEKSGDNQRQNRSGNDIISTSAASSEPQAAFEDNSPQDFVTIDPIAFKVLNKAAGDKLKRIETRFKVTIEIQATNDKTSTLTAVFQSLPNASNQDQIDAKEEFINLYQDMFFKIKRMPLKCEELPQDGVIRALKQTELKVPKIVIHRNEQNEYVFCGEESVVNEAIGIFRQEADIKPKQRRLLRKSNSGNGSSATNDPKTENRPVPNSYPGAPIYQANEHLVIQVLKADITKQYVDIIVNAADYSLGNGGGVAGAIAKAAGKQLQDECNSIMGRRRHRPIPVGENEITHGYNLNCKFVIHAVGPQYRQSDPPTFFRKLVDTYMNVLQCAETKAARSLAIPLISSGSFGGPKETCASALATAVYNFSSSREARHLQQVFLVNIDEEATTTLQSTFSGRFPQAGVTDEMSKQSNKIPPQADIKTSTFTTAEGIEIVVVKGDITKGSVKVIVNAANGRLAHGGGVAGAIARAAGRGIRDESNRIISQRQKPLNVGECAVTDGYNLKCRKVIHAVGPVYGDCKSDKQFVDLLRLTFLTAIKYANLPIEVKEVAFPLISSGIFGGPKHLCAQAFVEAVQEFSQNERNLVLQKIHMVNIDDEATQAVRHACQACFVQPQSAGIASPQLTNPISPNQSPDYCGVCAVTSKGISLHVIDGNIVEQDVDIIVNPATPTIWHSGGGISKAVFDKAGYRLEKHCKYILETVRGNKPLSVGETVVTSGFNLPCGQIIHTLSPYFDSTATSPNAFATKLEQTFLHCLKQGNAEGVQSIAFPLISSSTGPKKTCARAFAEAISAFEKSGVEMRLRNIIMVSNDKESISAVQNTLRACFSPTTSSDKAKGLTRHSGMKTREYHHKNKENVASAKTSTQSTAVVDTSRGMGTLTTTVNNQQPMTAITTQPTRQFKPSRIDIPPVTSHTGVQNTGAQYSDVVKRKTAGSYNQRQVPVSTAPVCGVCNVTKDRIHTLAGCKHRACISCIEKLITPNSSCQECGALFGFLEEHQFGGKMTYYQMNAESLPGCPFEKGFVVMKFNISNGFQNQNQPHPGKAFKGLGTIAYLPNSSEGREVLLLFRWAFLKGQLFKIRPKSSANGEDRLVPAEDITFKYQYSGGFEKGFPDSKYLPEMKRILDKKKLEFASGND